MDQSVTESTYYDLKFAFRVLDISADDVSELTTSLPDIPWLIGEYYKNPERRVASVDLEEGKSYEKLIEYIRKKQFPESNYGLFVSLTAEQSATGIDFPEYIIRFYKELGGQIAISIIVM